MAVLSPPVPLKWLPTRLASQQLGLSGETLRRLARNGYLEVGVHYKPGRTVTSPWLWDYAGIEQLLLEAATEREQAQQHA